MSRNLVAQETAAENRAGRPGGYTFHAPLAEDFAGVAFAVAVLRLGDHAHLDVRSGWAVSSPGWPNGARIREGAAGHLVLRWHEWELLRGILDGHDCFHIAEVERPTVGQLRHHLPG